MFEDLFGEVYKYLVNGKYGDRAPLQGRKSDDTKKSPEIFSVE